MMSIKPNELFFQHHLSGQGPKGEDLYNFQCQHGPAECKGNMVHACATKVVQSPLTVLKYIKCMIGDNYSPLEAGERYDFHLIYIQFLNLISVLKNG